MNKKTLFHNATAAIVMTSMMTGVTSCSSMSDKTKTRTQGTVMGTLGGAALGALAGLATGGDKKAVITGLVVGAAAGALTGFAWGESIVKQKEAYASTEEYVRDNNKQLDNRIAETKKYNQKLSQEVSKLRSEGKSLSAQERDNAKQGIALIQKDIDTAKQAKQDAQGADLAELNQKIANLDKEKSVLAELSGLAVK